MEQYISKSSLIAEIKNLKNTYKKLPILNSYTEGLKEGRFIGYKDVLDKINTLEVKEIENSIIPKHSYFESIYHCGSEPRWKIGDVLAVYEFYSDHEGEYVYGKITDVKMSEDEDWLYTFENGEVLYENMLITDEAYKKN